MISAHAAPADELTTLRTRLTEAEEALRAIRSGDVDAVMVTGKQGQQVFTLQGAEHAYRVLIESMNEGALTLTSDLMILYANQCFSRMVQCPLEKLMGSSFLRFLITKDQPALQGLFKQIAPSGAKIQVLLQVGEDAYMPAHISIRPLADHDSTLATIGMVITDMTEARRTEELLRSLTQRIVQVQEAERERVALELHDTITQPLCAILMRYQTLVDKLAIQDGPSNGELISIREVLGHTAKEVESISRNLRPNVLDQLGLVAALRSTSKEFADRTGVSVKLACVQLTPRVPPEIELALYRILQEALKNVEKHARARQVTVGLRKQGDFVQLVIADDGVGFDPDHHPSRRKDDLGLLSMRERAAYVGGEFKITSDHHTGTEIEIRIPLPSEVPVSACADQLMI